MDYRREGKIDYYLELAKVVSSRGTCLRRNYGAVIVKNDEVISSGYTGSPRGRSNCIDIGKCIREENKIPSGQRYELCRSVHAEANAIISASRRDMIDADLYLYGFTTATKESIIGADSCDMCKRMIINAGIKRVFIRDESVDKRYRMIEVSTWVYNDDFMIRLE